MGCRINHRPNTDGTRDYRLWPTFDANFNVTSLVTDQGKVVERYAYTPYGERIILNGSRNYTDSGADPDGSAFTVDTNGSDFTYGGSGFQGLWFDAETGQWYQRARYNHSSLGRFGQRDPIVYAGGTMNLYGFVEQNPVNRLDPEGLRIWDLPLIHGSITNLTSYCMLAWRDGQTGWQWRVLKYGESTPNNRDWDYAYVASEADPEWSWWKVKQPTHVSFLNDGDHTGRAQNVKEMLKNDPNAFWPGHRDGKRISIELCTELCVCSWNARHSGGTTDPSICRDPAGASRLQEGKDAEIARCVARCKSGKP
jgi:RHS repeat-associated protein